MNPQYVTDQLARSAELVRNLVWDCSTSQARWKPDRDTWSVLEVINHLYDEEGEDFRAHLDLVLHHPDQAWQRIDPQGWVSQRRYNERDFAESLRKFLDARQESLTWLQGLEDPNWTLVYEASFGSISAGDLLASWAAHDLLHTRQLLELQWAYNLDQTTPFSVRYAGDW